MFKTIIFAILLLALPLPGNAWWNPDWSFRKKITFDTTEAGANLKENLTQILVAVRLHSGNVAFADMKPDGTDIRFVSGDDKTPLKHHIESFDPANDMAIVWVQVPRLSAGAKTEFIWLYYGSKKAPKGDDVKGTYDGGQTLVLHFSEKEGAPKDHTAYNQNVKQSTAKLGAAGVLGGGATFDGTSKVTLAESPTLKMVAGGAIVFSAWVKLSEAQRNAVLFSHEAGAKSFYIGIDQAAIYARIATGGFSNGAIVAETPRRADLGIGTWRHVAVVAGDNRLIVYVDGMEAAATQAALPEIAGTVTIGALADGGQGFKGELDEVRLSNAVRSPDAIKTAFSAEGQDAKLLVYGEDEKAGGGSNSYFAILVDNLTVDAWVVIGILMVMLVVSFAIMVLKTRFLLRVESANRAFIEQFERLSEDLTVLDTNAGGTSNGPEAFSHGAADTHFARSPLFDLYRIGIRGLKHRFDLYREKGMALNLTPQAVDSIRAGLDAGIVRENARLNSQMVLLTIAISGGPFLGLLGTVVGVMITFAAIAAAGDVNVNAIAPGIAAALLATVAGLGVAIPALFGYNWLASRIKNISAEMHVFADELLTKLSETYSA
jgi:biopolymer transport protein ExbB